ncbi:MAG: restriction endonuclease subunit S [Acidobacteria bacterium]|nr:restriction endonuclease subunit S [Acidobacteriota bacterium]
MERVGSLCRLVNGRAFRPSDWSSQGLPIVRIQNLNDETRPFNFFNGNVDEKHLIDSGDVLLSWSGTPGTSFGCFVWSRGRAVLNQHIFRVTVDTDRMLKEFFAHALNSRLDEMISLSHGGVGLRHITKKKLERIGLPVPPLTVQRTIVDVIGECLERVEEIRKLRSESLRQASSLEGAVFADFVSGHVRRTKNTPVVPLARILLRTQYGTSSRANTSREGVPILRMGNIRDGHLDLADLKHIRLPVREIKKYILSDGDILFNRTNSLALVGKAATFTGLGGDWVFASYLIRLEVDRSRALPEYVTAVINSRIGRRFVHRSARRAIGMVNVNARQIRRMELPLPSVAEQQSLVERLREAKTASDRIRSDLSMESIKGLPGSVLERVLGGGLHA